MTSTTIRVTLMGRLAKYEKQLRIARHYYGTTGDDSWANRINELQGRIEELRYVLSLIK